MIAQTERRIWLVFEKLPHPDAVSYAADEEDVRLALELLDEPYGERQRLSEQLSNFVKEQIRESKWERKAVPCRRASGLYQPISWRFAKWLSLLLRSNESAVERTRRTMEVWIEQGERVQDEVLARPVGF